MPRRDILLDSAGNRVIVAGGYGFADGLQAVKQGIECRARLYRAEYWLDESRGVDYFGEVLIHNPHPLVVKQAIGSAIAETPDVTNVVAAELVIDGQTRHGTISYSANSTEGAISGTVAP